MQQTSLLAYQELRTSGNLGKRQEQVYNCLRDHGSLTNSEISRLVGLPINCVTPRTKELRKKGLVEKKFIRNCRVTGRKAIVWGIYIII